MIGARKGQDLTQLGALDLAFYYEEMVRCHLLELEVETPGGKIVLKRMNRGVHPLRRKSDFGAEIEAQMASQFSAFASPKVSPVHHQTINSPIIGVFYRASSPQSAPFVKEGDVVEAGTTVCIVEAMKVMNEIKAESRSRIVKILIENGKPVEKDQPLFYVDPAA